MRPDNAFTTPEQRFFFPNGMEAECHKSFDITGLPQAEVLDGEDGYIVIDEPIDGEEIAVQSWHRIGLKPGSQVKKIITLGERGDESSLPYKSILHPNGSDGSDDKKWLDNPVDTYEFEDDDLLVLEVNPSSLAPDAKIREQIDENRILLWPASEKLPYSDGEQEGDDDANDISYALHGIITSELKFISWKGGVGERARQLIDFAIANASMHNQLERTVLADSIGSASLMGMVQVEAGIASFLQYATERTGRDLVPTKDPNGRYGEFPKMTPSQVSRYDLVSEALYASMNQKIRRN